MSWQQVYNESSDSLLPTTVLLLRQILGIQGLEYQSPLLQLLWSWQDMERKGEEGSVS